MTVETRLAQDIRNAFDWRDRDALELAINRMQALLTERKEPPEKPGDENLTHLLKKG